MKYLTFLLVLTFAHLPAEPAITGQWIWCKDVYENGLTLSRNHCPIVTLYQDGSGHIDDYAYFKWSKDGNQLTLAFTDGNHSAFSLQQKTVLVYTELPEESKRTMKLWNETKKVYYLWTFWKAIAQ